MWLYLGKSAFEEAGKRVTGLVTRIVTLVLNLLLLAGILKDLALLPFELKNDLWQFLSRTANNLHDHPTTGFNADFVVLAENSKFYAYAALQ